MDLPIRTPVTLRRNSPQPRRNNNNYLLYLMIPAALLLGFLGVYLIAQLVLFFFTPFYQPYDRDLLSKMVANYQPWPGGEGLPAINPDAAEAVERDQQTPNGPVSTAPVAVVPISSPTPTPDGIDLSPTPTPSPTAVIATPTDAAGAGFPAAGFPTLPTTPTITLTPTPTQTPPSFSDSVPTEEPSFDNPPSDQPPSDQPQPEPATSVPATSVPATSVPATSVPATATSPKPTIGGQDPIPTKTPVGGGGGGGGSTVPTPNTRPEEPTSGTNPTNTPQPTVPTVTPTVSTPTATNTAPTPTATNIAPTPTNTGTPPTATATWTPTATATATATNAPPQAVDDQIVTFEDTITVTNVVANDSDPDADTLRVSQVTQGVSGTVAVSETNSQFVRYTPAKDAVGSDRFTYTISDGRGGTATAAVSVTILPVNDPPTFRVVRSQIVLPENSGPQTITGTITDVSPGPAHENGQTISVIETTSTPSLFSVLPSMTLANGSGTLSFTPAPGATGTATVTLLLQDNGGTANGGNNSSQQQTIIIRLTPTNKAPVAQNDTATTSEDTPVAIDVLANDSDPDGVLSLASTSRTSGVAYAEDQTGWVNPPSSVVTLTVVTAPLSGSARLESGKITYTPNPDLNGTDQLRYRICDAGGLCAQATVAITVTPVNDRPIPSNDEGVTDEDTPLTLDLVTNDRDPDGDSLTLTATSYPTVTLVGDGRRIVYTPPTDFNGIDRFTYTVCDNGTPQLCATGNVTIAVTPQNDRPETRDDSFDTFEDTPILLDVLANDIDVDGNLNPASLTVTSAPLLGTATVNSGRISYTPRENVNSNMADERFSYQVCDTLGECSSATVFLTIVPVNDAPSFIKSGGDITVAEDSSNTASPGNYQIPGWATSIQPSPASATDEASQALNFLLVPNNSQLFIDRPAITPSGTLTFTLAPDAYGSATVFVYLRDDGGNDYGGINISSDQVFVITVTPVNDPPDALDDFVQTNEDTPLVIDVLANDRIAPDAAETIRVVSTSRTPPSVTLQPDGKLIYVPQANFNGADTFTYTICDSGTAPLCDTAQVVVDVRPVNDAPVARNDSITTAEDTITVTNVLDNDTDVDGDELTITSDPIASHGTVTRIDNNRNLRYQPAANFNGTDSFSYTVSDGNGGTATAVVSVTVTSVNDPPVNVASAWMVEIPENQTLLFQPMLLQRENNDTADGQAYTTLVIDDMVFPPTQQGGTLTRVSDTFTYVPAPDFNGIDSFTYHVCDNGIPSPQECITAVARIKVDSVNSRPVAVDDTQTVGENTTTTIDLLANDRDPDYPGLPAYDSQIIAIGASTEGATITPVLTRSISYTPRPNFVGTDFFTYTIRDFDFISGGLGLTSTARVTITVTAINDPPEFTMPVTTTNLNEDAGVVVLANWLTDVWPGPAVAIDENGQLVVPIVTTSDPSFFDVQPTIILTGGGPKTGELRFRANPNAYGTTTVSVYLIDDGGTAAGGSNTSATQTFTITVNPLNDPPVFELQQAPAGTPAALTPNIYVDEDSGPYSQARVVNVSPGGRNTTVANNWEEVTQTVTFAIQNDNPLLFSVAPTLTQVANVTAVTTTRTSTLSFTPAAEASGQATLRITAYDGIGGVSAEQIIVIYVNPVNDAPVAQNDTVTLAQYSGSATINVLANDSDTEGHALSISAITVPPADGTVTIAPGGQTLNYNPSSTGWAGTTNFMYQVCDNVLAPLVSQCTTATVNITVVPATTATVCGNVTFTPSAVAVDADTRQLEVVMNNPSGFPISYLDLTIRVFADSGETLATGGAQTNAPTTTVNADNFPTQPEGVRYRLNGGNSYPAGETYAYTLTYDFDPLGQVWTTNDAFRVDYQVADPAATGGYIPCSTAIAFPATAADPPPPTNAQPLEIKFVEPNVPVTQTAIIGLADEARFEVTANRVGAANGTGIAFVAFRIVDTTDSSVVHVWHEYYSLYCAFGDVGATPVLPCGSAADQRGIDWWNNTLVAGRDYRIEAFAIGRSGNATEVISRTFRKGP